MKHPPLALLLAIAFAGPVRLAAAPEPAGTVSAGDLLAVLVEKGVLTGAEAEGLSREASARHTTPTPVVPAGRASTRLSVGGRLQTQFVSVSQDHETAPDPADALHLFLRRACVFTKAELGPAWEGALMYDLANSSFDLAVARWKGDGVVVETGYRVAGVAREQTTSNSRLKAIERSAATRYFAEDSGGTGLGAASYRVGVFADGKADALFWHAALTNPEPASSIAARAPGDASTNRPAVWIGGGWQKSAATGSFTLGAAGGFLPDQGGAPIGGAGRGDDLAVGDVYLELERGSFALLTEVLAARDEGAVGGRDANCVGAFIQPSWRFSPALEGVFRAGALDTDGRGAELRQVLPGSTSALPADRLIDFYLGGTWYLQGDDLKLQAGLIHARGESAKANGAQAVEAVGLRSQLQVLF